MSTNINALNNFVFVKRDEKQTETDSGIVLTDKSASKPLRGTVVSVGHGKYLDNGHLVPPPVNVGDKVLFGARAGEEIDIEDGDTYVVLTGDELLAKVE